MNYNFIFVFIILYLYTLIIYTLYLYTIIHNSRLTLITIIIYIKYVTKCMLYIRVYNTLRGVPRMVIFILKLIGDLW